MKHQKQIPLGIKLLSIFGLIVGGLVVLFGMAFTSLGFFGPSNVEQADWFLPVVMAFSAIFGIIFLLFGLFIIFVARALWKGKNWARILVVIFSVLGAIPIIAMIFGAESVQLGLNAIFGPIVNLLVAGYLLFNKKAKEFFSK